MLVDEKDKKILNMLAHGPHITQKQIAKKIGLTPPAVNNRIQRLKEKKVLLGTAPIIALDKIGYDLTVIVNVKIKSGQLEEAAEKYAKDPFVCASYRITGDYDMLLIVKLHNTKELNEWNKIMTSDSKLIERTNTSLAIHVKKEGTTPTKIE